MTERRNQRPPIEPADDQESVGLREMCMILELRSDRVCEWVAEGVLRPSGQRLGEWRFTTAELERARRARRLQRDLELNTAALPLVLDLLGEVHRLRRRLRVMEERFLE